MIPSIWRLRKLVVRVVGPARKARITAQPNPTVANILVKVCISREAVLIQMIWVKKDNSSEVRFKNNVEILLSAGTWSQKHRNDTWLLDSGASSHMSSDRSNLVILVV